MSESQAIASNRHREIVCHSPRLLPQPASSAFDLGDSGPPVIDLSSAQFATQGLRVSRIAKGVLDRAVAFVALLVALPVLLAVALAIRLTSSGPVFYSQARVGRGGTTFRFYKFRTMVDGADRMVEDLVDHNDCDRVLFKMHEDPRITGIGRWLRRFSLDELPQLWNVLRGDMSIVGPRPALPTEVDAYEDAVHLRHVVKPGLTGLWQVSGRSDLSWEEAVGLDLHYVENWSLVLDSKILVKTIPAVVTGRGAY